MSDKTKAQSWIETISTVIQGITVILGVGFAVNELVLKDREAMRQRTEVTLNYTQKIRDEAVLKAMQKLRELRDYAYSVPVDVPEEHGMRMKVTADFEATRDIALYYDVLNRGIEAGYFDSHLAQLMLQQDAAEVLDLLGELQSRIGNKLFRPERFRSVETFYARCPGTKPPKITFAY